MGLSSLIAFSSNQDLLHRMDDEIFSGLYTSYTMMYDPEVGSSSIISQLCTRMWTTFLIKNVIHDNRFLDLRSKIEDDLSSKNKRNLRTHLISLNEAGSSIVDLSASLSDFRRVVDSSLQPILGNKAAWITDLPIVSKDTFTPAPWKALNDKSILELLAVSINDRLSELTTLLNQQISKYEKLNAHISNIVNLDIQTNLTKLTIISVITGIAAAAAAIIIAFK